MNHTPPIFRPPWWRCFVSSLSELIPLLLSTPIAVLLLASIGNRPVSLDFVFIVTRMHALINLLTTSRTQDQKTITVSNDMIVRPAA